MYKNGELEMVMSSFEKALKKAPIYVGGGMDRADMQEVDIGNGRTSRRFVKNNYYNHGTVNQLFLMYFAGYACGKLEGQHAFYSDKS